MAQLSTIVSSILRDMVYAQHQANMYAVSLEDIYRKGGRLEDFAMPAIALGEMELSLRYGIADSSAQVEQYEINYPVLREMAKTFSRAGAVLLIDSVLPALRQSMPQNISAEDNWNGKWSNTYWNLWYPRRLDSKELRRIRELKSII